jgi:hypothetical protein
VFGDVPNVQLLTTKLFAISEGRRDLMQLAQHLVDREVVPCIGALMGPLPAAPPAPGAPGRGLELRCRAAGACVPAPSGKPWR